MKTRTLLLAICFFAIAAIPRFLSLEAHWSNDESRWLSRGAVFIYAIKQRDFSNTCIAPHPGVTTMWIAGLRTFFTEPHIDLANLACTRWGIGIVVWAGIGVAGFLLYRLYSLSATLASLANFSFSPLFLAQTRRVHTDALATVFILLTVLLFLTYCQRAQRYRYLIFSGGTFGLALMSKSYALILLPWVPLCLFMFHKPRTKSRNPFFTHVAEVLCFLNGTTITLILIWPVFWTLPFGILGACLLGTTCALGRALKRKKIALTNVLFWASTLIFAVTCVCALQTLRIVLDGVGWAVTTPHDVEHFFFGEIVNDPGWLFYPFVLLIKGTPLVLPFAIVGVFILCKQRKRSDEATDQFKIALALVASIVLFIVCLSATRKKFARYLLPVFSLLEILSAIGFVELLRGGYAQINSYFRTRAATHKKALIAVACLGFFFIQVLPVLALHPYYSTYYNIFWKGTDITKMITVNDTAGVDLAAEYLNKKPNAAQISVRASDMGSEFFEYYFKGTVYRTDKNHIEDADILPVTDYEVIYIRDSQIGWAPQEGIKGGTLEHVITLNGIDYVRIYRIPSPEE